MAGQVTLQNNRHFFAAGNLGEDFTNSLVAGLAPLLGLFGERFAQQFLSESFTFKDRILFAMAPLGVLTAISGAIRVGGASWLKRLIGRARENKASVEIELMSSVSQEVCEIWNGQSIIRSTGQPQVKQIIHLPSKEGDISPESFITMNSNTWTKGYELRKGDKSAEITGSKKLPAKLPEQHLENITVTGVTEDADSGKTDNYCDLESLRPKDTVRPIEHKEMPPNISLNIHGESNPVELARCAFIATMLQVTVLGWSGFLAYSSFTCRHKINGLKPLIGFVLQAIGTMFLTLSLVLCAGIIENGRKVQQWSRFGDSQMRKLANDQSANEKPFNRRDMQLYWLQKQHNAGGSSLDPYILYAEELNDKIYESHRAEGKGHNYLTNTAVMFGILGFVAQFQGLRFSNWTCSIAQFVALAIATILRAGVRRNMTKTPIAIQVNNDYILDHLTLALVDKKPSDSKFPNLKAFESPRLFFAFGVNTVPELKAITSESEGQVQSKSGHSNRASLESASSGSEPPVNMQRSTEAKKKLSLAQQALNLRVRLGHITKWTGPKSQEAIILSNTIESALENLSPRILYGKYAVVLQINIFRTMQYAPPTSRPGSQQQVESYVSSASMPSSQEEVELKLTHEGGKWKVDDAELEALLSLVAYSAWTADQDNKKYRGGTPAHTDHAEDPRTERQVTLGNDSIGWLREKSYTLQMYDIIIGKSSPKLLSDLHWWTPNTGKGLKEVDIVPKRKQNRLPTRSKGSLFDSVPEEARVPKQAERPALGYYTDEKTKNIYDFWCFECREQHVFMLHLFSTFIWAIAECLDDKGLHTRSTILSVGKVFKTSKEEISPMTRQQLYHFYSTIPQPKSDQLETLVQELQEEGLGTSEEIYRVLIPPLSYFDKLPNERVADWFDNQFINKEANLGWDDASNGCVELLNTVQHRRMYDRFANQVGKLIIEFISSRVPRDSEDFDIYFEKIKKYVENNDLLKKILQDGLRLFYRPDIASKLGVYGS